MSADPRLPSPEDPNDDGAALPAGPDGATSPVEPAPPPRGSAAEDSGLPISAVAARTGISPDTLRVWQRRYGLGASRQSAGGHRRYTSGDLDRLRAVQKLLEQGASIGQAARSVLREASLDLPLPTVSLPAARRLAAAAADLDGPAVRTLLRDHIRAHGVLPTWEDMLRPVLAAIGERWSSLPHGIAVEHLLSRAASITFGETMSEFHAAQRSAPTVLLACVPGEEHDLPIVALGAALAERGVTATMLPVSSTIAEIADEAIRYPALTVLYAHDADGRWLAAPRIWPSGSALLVAGPGWDRARLPASIRYTNTLAESVRVATDPGAG